MGSKLVIVESPAKAKTINKILGSDFSVKPSMGHVRDLPVKNMGVDLEHGFEPKYVVAPGKKKIVDELRKAARESEAIYLAPDPDREGEAIAWHLYAVLHSAVGKKVPFYRVQYNEITPRAVKQAFEKPGQIDTNRVNAQQARRVLDRIVGYKVSPMLWQRVRRGLSAGRVQSVALRLVCEREEEIARFKPEEFWLIGAKVRKFIEPREPFRIKLIRVDGAKPKVPSAEAADAVKKDLAGRDLTVTGIRTMEVARRAPPPFITSSLQQAGSTHCGFSPDRTMSIAQRLYEGVEMGEGSVGLITYMRTDSFTIAQDALNECRGYISRTFGESYCPKTPNYFKNRGTAQEAHEAIRPTDVNRTPDKLAGVIQAAELNLYGLIWKRFVASQMAPAVILQRIVKIDSPPASQNGATYQFQAAASDIKFPGYMKLTGTDTAQPRTEGEEERQDLQALPPLAEGEKLDCMEWLADRKETQPPTRYSEASLIKALENNGVGRPSTYAQIISTLQKRKYVDTRKRTLFSTELGMQVSRLLTQTLETLFNVKFTASMEESLDKIESGAVEWTGMLSDFYGRFQTWMSQARIPDADAGKVEVILKAVDQIKEWGPDVVRGKRVFSESKFVESLKSQMGKGKQLSQRQLEALAKIVVKRKNQIEGAEAILAGAGLESLLSAPEMKPPSEITQRKLRMLEGLTLDESTTAFVDSLRNQAVGGRELSIAQIRALDRIIVRQARQIPDFEKVKADLQLSFAEPPPDTDSAPLLDAMGSVKEWGEPKKRGNRVFDDKAFYSSLRNYHGKNGYLSPKQQAALKKMVRRYKDQIPDFESLPTGRSVPSSVPAVEQR